MRLNQSHAKRKEDTEMITGKQVKLKQLIFMIYSGSGLIMNSPQGRQRAEEAVTVLLFSCM